MSSLRFSLVSMLFLVVASQFFAASTFAQVSKDAAASALAAAEKTVVSAYQAVSKAEESGADVSSLLIRLNEAGWLLACARIAYKSGDFDSALKFATQSQEKLNGFVADANALTENAVQERYRGFMVNVVGSVIGAIDVVCVGIIVWYFLKRKYEKAGGMG